MKQGRPSLFLGAAAAWFLLVAFAVFLRRGIWLGGLIFVATGISFAILALRRRR